MMMMMMMMMMTMIIDTNLVRVQSPPIEKVSYINQYNPKCVPGNTLRTEL